MTVLKDAAAAAIYGARAANGVIVVKTKRGMPGKVNVSYNGVHLYSPEVQNRCITLGLTTHEKIKRNALIFKAVCVPGYIAYVLVCVYALNGAKGFVQGFWQLLVILSVMNLIDRFWVDGYWVGHTNAWEIPGTEDLKPQMNQDFSKTE